MHCRNSGFVFCLEKITNAKKKGALSLFVWHKANRALFSPLLTIDYWWHIAHSDGSVLLIRLTLYDLRNWFGRRVFCVVEFGANKFSHFDCSWIWLRNWIINKQDFVMPLILGIFIDLLISFFVVGVEGKFSDEKKETNCWPVDYF